MKRREWIFAAIGLVLLIVGWRVGESHRLPATDFTFEGSCRVPFRVIGDRAESGQPSVIVLHGLGANQMVMEAISQALASANMKVYVPDLPGHGNNSSPFTFPQAEACAVEAIGALARDGKIQLDKTVFLGHSMGGALAIRLADYFPTAATVAISPAPLATVPGMPPAAILIAPPRRMPVNLIVFLGQFDFPFTKRSAESLVRSAGGERYKEPEDFQQRRAIRLVTIAGDTHTGLIYDVRVWDLILNGWLAASLSMPLHSNLSRSVFLGPAMGVVGLFFFFPLVSSSVAGALHGNSSESKNAAPFRAMALVFWVIAGLCAVSVLNFAVPLRFLKMYAGDYLASCLLITGIVLCALPWRKQRKASATELQPSWQSALTGAAMGFFAMLAIGAWMNWALSDMWLNAARWMRFPVILLSCLPYAIAEEWVLGAPSGKVWPEKSRRYLLFFILRLAIWLSILFAVYLYSSQQVLLAVLVFFMGVFSFLVRLGADAIRRRTATPAGAAVFTAILMAWFVAAIFPLK